MANSDKVITVTPATGSSNEPSMVFTGGDNNPLTMRVMDDGTLSYEASEGQVFSVSESLEGDIFSVSDISGIPLILGKDTGDLQLNPHSGTVLVGTTEGNDTAKMQIEGSVTVMGTTRQLFSANDDDDTETLYSVTDISGVPSIRVKDDGDVYLAEHSGNLGVGTTSPQLKKGMHVHGGFKLTQLAEYPNNITNGDYVFHVEREDSRDWAIFSGATVGASAIDYGVRVQCSPGASYAMAVDNPSGYVFRVTGAGSSLAVAHSSISDVRLKENISTITGSLDTIKNLRGVNFTWIDNSDAGTQVGMIAQEVEEHIPSVIHNDAEESVVLPDGSTQTHYKHVEYGKLVPVLIEAMKEQQAMIEALQTRLDDAGL